MGQSTYHPGSLLSFAGAVCVTAALLRLYPDDVTITVDPCVTTTEISWSFSGSPDPLPSEADVARFEALADRWRHETLDLSSLTEIVAHPAYLSIIAMGKPATPLLLAELEKRPTHWFVALAAINQTNPVPAEDAGNFKKMTEAWLRWGRQRAI